MTTYAVSKLKPDWTPAPSPADDAADNGRKAAAASSYSKPAALRSVDAPAAEEEDEVAECGGL
jgi:hypothetical protein